MRVLGACVAGWLVLMLSAWSTLGATWLVALSCALTIGILHMAASASGTRGWTLVRLLVFLYGGISVLNIQIESLAFTVQPPGAIVRNVAVGLLEVVAVSAVLAIAITREHRGGAATSHRLAPRLWLRLPAVALSYVVLYLTAGSLIYPFVRYFYMNNAVITVPAPGLVIGTQVVRGLIYASALIPLLRAMEGRRAHAALVAGLALSVLGGIAPLLLPVDDILPPEVRGVHMLEILGSNFLLGVISSFLLVRRMPGTRGAATEPVPA
jgi:hypothetical protein